MKQIVLGSQAKVIQVVEQNDEWASVIVNGGRFIVWKDFKKDCKVFTKSEGWKSIHPASRIFDGVRAAIWEPYRMNRLADIVLQDRYSEIRECIQNNQFVIQDMENGDILKHVPEDNFMIITPAGSVTSCGFYDTCMTLEYEKCQCGGDLISNEDGEYCLSCDYSNCRNNNQLRWISSSSHGCLLVNAVGERI